MKRTVMIVAGGTGGHVYPGLAVAAALEQLNFDLHWLGSAHGIEARLVEAADIPFTSMPVTGLRRSGWRRRVMAPLNVLLSIAYACSVMLKQRPSMVLGMGGYVSGPGGIAAWLCRVPLVIHEQNAIAGLTNRILSRFARRILQAFPGTFADTDKVYTVGNPVRAEITQRGPDKQVSQNLEQAFHLLVFGGSRGAQALNELLPQAVAQSGIRELIVTHQCGHDDVESTRQSYQSLVPDLDVSVVAYIDNMPEAYRCADLVVSRAGALSVAEIAAAGVASILIPFPFAVDDHQTKNARYLADGGAALLFDQQTVTPAELGAVLKQLAQRPEQGRQMAAAASKLAKRDATDAVVKHCLAVINA